MAASLRASSSNGAAALAWGGVKTTPIQRRRKHLLRGRPDPYQTPVTPLHPAHGRWKYYSCQSHPKQNITAEPHRTLPPTALGVPVLAELWNSVIDLKHPPIDWVEWLFNSTIHQASQITSHYHHLRFNRLLSIALGLMVRSLRSYRPLSPLQLEENNSKLLDWLSKIQTWQESTQSFGSDELNHRRMQLNNLLVKNTSEHPHQKPLESVEHVVNQIRSSTDPYLVSTLLREKTEEELEGILQSLNASSTPGTVQQEQLIRSIKVICRSKGKLIYQTHPNGGPHEILSDAQVKEMLLNHPKPSLWKTGLTLSFAESLVGQINMLINEGPSSSRSSQVRVDQAMVKLTDLIGLNLSDLDINLYGGSLEKFRLLRRQTDGIEILIQHLLLLNSSSNDNHHDENVIDGDKEPYMPDFHFIFDLIQGGLDRLGCHSIRARTWKSVISTHLKFSSRWDGPDGLSRCFDLITHWCLGVNNKHQSAGSFLVHLAEEPPMKFKKILPGDLGLLMIERVLFPRVNLRYKEPYSSSSPAWSSGETKDGFEALIKRIGKMKRFIQVLGNPRRFRDRRLMRLIYLNVQKKQMPGCRYVHPEDELRPEGLCQESLGYQHVDDRQGDRIPLQCHHPSYLAMAWWNRIDVWRDLEFKLNSNPAPNHIQQTDHSPLVVDLNQTTQKTRPSEQVEVNDHRWSHDWSFEFCNHPLVPDLSVLDDGGSARGTLSNNYTATKKLVEQREQKDRTKPCLEDPSDLSSTHQANREIHEQDKSHYHNSNDRQLGHNHPSKAQRSHGLSYLDATNQHLKLRSKDFFHQHSLVVCLIQMLKNSLTPSSITSSNPIASRADSNTFDGSVIKSHSPDEPDGSDHSHPSKS